MKKIVILGGGFAGVEVAIGLRNNKNTTIQISNKEYLYSISKCVPILEKSFDEIKYDQSRLIV